MMPSEYVDGVHNFDLALSGEPTRIGLVAGTAGY